MFPSINSAQPTDAPIAGGVPSTASPTSTPTTAPNSAGVTPTTAPTPADISPTTAPTPADVTPTLAPTPAVNDLPTSEPTINAETDEPANVGEPTIEPTVDETKPPKHEGKGKGKGKRKSKKGKSKGKGKGHSGKGKGNMHMYGGKGAVKGVVHYNKGFKVYSNFLFRNMDKKVETNDNDDTTDGENDDYNLFPLIQGPNP
jgi:hypothetical protein